MINERNLSKPELNKREDIIMNMKKNKRDLVNKYGKDAEAVMYGRATNMAKKQTKEMRNPKLTELIKDALKNPKTKKNIKETSDEKAWGKLDRLRDAIGDDDYIIQSLMKALSTDDANLYLDAMIRDHIDIVADDPFLNDEGEESVYGDKTIDETVEDYITSVDDLSETNITESMNMNKWRRAYNGKAFAKKVVYLEDYNGNKKRYVIFFKYKETPSKDIVYLRESQIGKHEGSGMGFAMSNLQNNPTYLFTSDDIMEFDTEEQFDDFVDDGAKGLESLLSFFLGGQNVDKAIKAWFDTGVTDKSKLRIGPAEYLEGAAVNEGDNDVDLSKVFMKGVGQGGEKNPDQLTDEPEKESREERIRRAAIKMGMNPKHIKIAEKLAKKLKEEEIREALPKGYWDKKIDAKDEDQDGKIDESYDTLVNKIKKSGKSAKAAKAIAGAVASYKAKGGGKGPTAKQK